MARRFAVSQALGSDPDIFGVNPFNNNGSPIINTSVGGLVFTDSPQMVIVAPSAYSQPRKVVFWAVFRHETSGADISIPCRLRVFPTSSSQTQRLVASFSCGSGEMVSISGNGSVIPNDGDINSENVLYGAQSSRQNNIFSTKFGTLDTPGGQLVWQEFDLFEAGDADFWSDWNAVAAIGDDDVHVGFGLGIERGDGSAWTFGSSGVNTIGPVITSSGCAVVQAPSPENNTRIYVPATSGVYNPGAISNSSFGGNRTDPFIWHEDEWAGDVVEVRYCMRMRKSGGASGASVSIRVNTIEIDSAVLTPIFTESLTLVDLPVATMARSSDIRSLLTDGDILEVSHRSDTASSQNLPYGWWEITVKNASRITTFFHCGHQSILAATIPGSPPFGSITYGKNESLFDPVWFTDMEASRFISTRIQGGLEHFNVSNDVDQQVNMNADLDADVSTSAFNVVLAPEISSTPNATLGKKIRDGELTGTNPVNVAGKRKFTQRYGGTLWTAGSFGDVPGGMGLLYVIDVPNTDVVALGPLFDIGSFDAEGCAATSAGLGEPPLLVITNGSTTPKKFNPTAAGTNGEIEDAGIPLPFEGEVPSTTPGDAASSPQGGLELGSYIYRYTFRNCCTGKESDPNPDDIIVDTTGQSPAAQVTLSFAGVRIPGDPQICEICIYRTVNGGDFPIMAKVGCFNVDDTSIFIDDTSDDALDFLNEGLSILNAPMPCVSVVVDYRNRLFGMGDIPDLAPAGTVSVVHGSDIIEGDANVLWDRCLEGKFIKVGADCRSYEIERVLPPLDGFSPAIQRLKLVDLYEGTDDTGLSYIICGRPNRLYFSEPLEPECWPNANFIDIEPGDGDRLMGAVSNYDRLIICKRRKSYVLTFRENPGLEVIVPSRVSSDIGCVGPRTFAQIEVGSVWLADRGLAIFDGRSISHVPESESMNDIFVDPDNPNYIRRDRNGRVIEAVGVFYPRREQYLLLLPTVQTSRGCNMMLVWDVKLRNITLLKFCQEFLSMVVGKDSEGNERVYLGDTNGFVWIYDIGDTDGVGFPNATGTVRGTVTNAGIDEITQTSFLDDSTASFIDGGVPGLAGLSGIEGLSGALGGADMGIAGVCVYVRRSDAAYDDPWVSRTIYASTPTRLYVTPQWGPDTPFDETGEISYDYMIGAIEFDQLFKPQNYGTDDMSKRDWGQIVVHEAEDFGSLVRIDLLPDFQMTDPEADTVVDPITGETGQGRIFAMDYSKGRQTKPVGRNVHHFMAVRMRNFAPEEPVRIINHLLRVTPRTSK